MRYYISLILISFLTFSCNNEKSNEEIVTVPEEAEESPQFIELGVMCGTVQFEDGCSPQIDSLISFGLALVHHMTYDDAEYNFAKVIEMDPDCFWGHWGKALSYIHPIWPDQPSNERLQRGLSLVSKALALAQKEKEKYYGQALAAYYKDGLMLSEKERLVSYETAWGKVKEKYPDDIEASLFHGLSRLSTASQSDKSYTTQREVGKMAEATLEVIPDHPGGFHYAIHSYDYPPLAEEAVRVAKNYSSIAPDIPHALHMPTHIFTRLGHWDDSIEGNVKSAKVARRMPVNGAVSLHYVHALDYLVYAYLQKSQSVKAEEVYLEMIDIKPPFQNSGVVAYALAAIPARMALENQNWESAANLELPFKDQFPWEEHPQFSSITYFAKGIGAARNGDMEMANHAYEVLDSMHLSMGDSFAKAYWATQMKIQKIAVKGWVTYMNGDKEEGMKILEEAAKLEDSTTKSPVTPGELLPMREMLGDLYLEQGQAGLALENYKKSLERNPNRFNTIYGAALAAEALENKEEANAYFISLLALGGETDPDKSQIKYAFKYING